MQKIQIHLGESMREVLATNQRADYNPKEERDDSPIIWPVDDSKPEVFDYTYNDPQGAVRFPHARMIWATQYAGVVTDVLISASERKLPLTQFYVELKDTADQLSRAGWKADVPLPTLQTLQSAVAASDATGLEGGMLTFTKGTVKASLDVKGFSSESGKASAESSEYVLNARFSDPASDDVQQNKVFDERHRVKGTINDNLTLAYWIDRTR